MQQQVENHTDAKFHDPNPYIGVYLPETVAADCWKNTAEQKVWILLPIWCSIFPLKYADNVDVANMTPDDRDMYEQKLRTRITKELRQKVYHWKPLR